MLHILVFIHVPDELQGKILHLPLENLVKPFILLNSQVIFPVSDGTWEEKQVNCISEDSREEGTLYFSGVGEELLALSFFSPKCPPLTPAHGHTPSLSHLLDRGQTHPGSSAVIEDH